ncbi:MAG TPA: hypothetical protein VGP70_07935 [Actinomadura sp.]|jgi:hypothetical protein|nr:hypothetical protein [Actinomadura sp.]
MQLPRVVIAVVFFVIGALIAIPALTRTATTSRASGTPTPTGSPTPATTPSGSGTAGASGTPAPSTTSGRRPTPTPTRPTVAPPPVTHTPTPTPTRPSATPTFTARPPVRPLTVAIGAVRCPGRSVTVTVTSVSDRTEDYAVELNGSAMVADRIGPKTTRTNKISLTEDRATTVSVTWRNEPVKSARRKADCTGRTKPPESLPRTGPDDATMYARIATGVAAMITGVVIFWYGGIWPRRRESMLPKKKTG